MTFKQAEELLKNVQTENEIREIEAIKKQYPDGLPVGSPIWYAWKDKIK